MSLKATAVPGRNGSNLKAKDFKYSRGAYWLTSREAPNVFWMEKLDGKDQAVKAYLVRNKSEIEDKHFLDHADSFDTFLQQWQSKSLVSEYHQAPTKKDEVGDAFPNLNELNDIVVSTQGTGHWTKFMDTGEQVDEQDLDGFEGYDEDELGDDDCEYPHRAENVSMLGTRVSCLHGACLACMLTYLTHASCLLTRAVDDEEPAEPAQEAAAPLEAAALEPEVEAQATLDVDAPRTTTREVPAAMPAATASGHNHGDAFEQHQEAVLTEGGSREARTAAEARTATVTPGDGTPQDDENFPALATLLAAQALKVGDIIDIFERSKVFHTGVVTALDPSVGMSRPCQHACMSCVMRSSRHPQPGVSRQGPPLSLPGPSCLTAS